MDIGIIDADLIGRTRHRFPNLVCMKISNYYKVSGGNRVVLITEYTDSIKKYDKVFLSKVFTDTKVPAWVLSLPNIEYGGTGFFYDKSPPLSYEIEHCMPDYHLYDNYVQKQIDSGAKRNEFKYYLDYSIGFLTRGCFRQCEFCVNKNYKSVQEHSQLNEFVDMSRKKICLLDDNFFGCKNWKNILNELIALNKPFQFKQGLDERLLTEEKIKMLHDCKYDGDYIFAFDNIADYDIIEQKLKLLRKYITTSDNIKFYVLCGFDRNGKYDKAFWEQDLWDLFKRIELLMKYQCLPYVMRYEKYNESPYRGTYINVAAWCNQPVAFKKKTYREYVECQQLRHKKECSETRYLKQIEKDIPALANTYFDMKCEHWNKEKKS